LTRPRFNQSGFQFARNLRLLKRTTGIVYNKGLTRPRFNQSGFQFARNPIFGKNRISLNLEKNRNYSVSLEINFKAKS
jgi:hypothetical protein